MPVYAAKKCAANAAHTVGLHNDPVNLLEERSDESQVQPDVRQNIIFRVQAKELKCNYLTHTTLDVTLSKLLFRQLSKIVSGTMRRSNLFYT